MCVYKSMSVVAGWADPRLCWPHWLCLWSLGFWCVSLQTPPSSSSCVSVWQQPAPESTSLCTSVVSCLIDWFFSLRRNQHRLKSSRLLTCCVCVPGLELCEPSLRLMVTVLAGLMTVAGELLLLGVAVGCQSWRGLLGAGAAPLTLFLSYGCSFFLLSSLISKALTTELYCDLINAQ